MAEIQKTDKRSQGRKNAPVLNALTDERKRGVWEANRGNHRVMPNSDLPIPISPCHIWTGSMQNGYPSISQGHGKSKIKVHMLAAWIHTGQLPAEDTVVSHLCHRKLCINPDHLIIESITSNNSRKGCLCACSDSVGRTLILCCHVPRCLRRDTDTVGNFEPFPVPIENDIIIQEDDNVQM